MKISELIEILKDRKAEHGDLDVVIDPCDGSGTMAEIEDIDTATDHDGLIIWVDRLAS